MNKYRENLRNLSLSGCDNRACRRVKTERFTNNRNTTPLIVGKNFRYIKKVQFVDAGKERRMIYHTLLA